MTAEQTFRWTVSLTELGRCSIDLPFDPKAVFGKVRAPVRVRIDRHEDFPTTVYVYGGVAGVGLRKGQVADFGLVEGDEVEVTIRLDEQPRSVEPPAEIAERLSSEPGATATWEALSYSHRREYARWITQAKRAETRRRRADRALEMLRAGVRTPDTPRT